ncbi:MAG: SDR family NAD(P)-dependent oxidoreductase [Pseudomonadales bacterium]|jgi:NAD(P)-dependent dehydrogenase (short-subunit alcohol dehydrogenase family)
MVDFAMPNFSIDLSDQVALVTGTTSGLGKRFAQILAKCGAKVVLTGRRVEKLDELAAQIRGDGGICEPLTMDMTDRESIRSTLVKAEDTFGPITTLINNAGIPDAQVIVRMSDELIDNVFNTNLVGPWILSSEFAKRLIKEKLAGRIVNISSIAAFNTTAQSSAALYATTKSGIARMTEAMAVEWARFNINVNCIAPGAFSSEMLDGMLERIGDISVGFPRRRICDPAQMDSTLLFLVSPSSECVTGTIIKVDDGQSPR